MEKILCAAIYYDDGIAHVHQPKNIKTGYVICGRRHHNVIATSSILGVLTKQKNIQGFLTSKDRFVDRAEAEEIAIKAEQIKKPLIGSVLTSEDLY